MTVFENIKKYSKIRGYNLQTVAEKAGLSRNVIYQYNKGKNPSLETLAKIAKVLNVPVDNLLSDEKIPSSEKVPTETEKMFFRTIADQDGMTDDQYKNYLEKVEQFARFARADIENDIKNGK